MVRDPSPHTAAKTSGPIVYIEGRVQFSIMLREKRFHPKTFICTNNIYGHVLFVCLGFYIPLNKFSLIWRRLHYRWRASFDLHSELMVIEQWGCFSVPHVLWRGAAVYNGHHRGTVTLIPVAERLAVELSLPVYRSVVAGIRIHNLPRAMQTL